MKDVWETVIKAGIKKQVPAHSFKMWIDPISFIKGNNQEVTLSCPNFFSKKRVLGYYSKIIEKELAVHLGHPCRLVIEISDKQKTMRNQASAETVQIQPDKQMRFSDLSFKPANGRLFRKDFTFDRFVVGQNNNFAYSAALSLASQKHFNQNSLFLMSPPGLGKSHLSQAIGHHILKKKPNENVYYVTAEDFTNEMVRSIRSNSIETFKEKYRNHCDVLLLEDVQFLTGKERTQQELSQALDYLLNAEKKIIFTGCCLPSDIPKLNEQLRSRLNSSLISNIEIPDFETRVNILKTKMREKGCKLPMNIVEYLAGTLSDNIRQLESGLIGVTARASLTGAPIDLNLAETVVNSIAHHTRSITIEYIKDMVCRHYSVSKEDIVSKSRKKAITRPRQVAIYLARKYTKDSFQVIGKSFNRYHATAIYSVGAVEKKMKSDGSLKSQVEYLSKSIENIN